MNSASFNQDASCVSVATQQGYRIYGCCPFGRFYASREGTVAHTEMLFSTSLITVVGKGDDPALSPRKLKVVNTKRELVICELTFPTSVLRTLMNRSRLVVVLEEQIFIYNIANMKLLHSFDTVVNPRGVASLATMGDLNVLVYPSGSPARHTVAPTSPGQPQARDTTGGPASTTGPQGTPAPRVAQRRGSTSVVASGDVTVLDCTSLQPLNVLRAHKSPLALLQLSPDGSLLATASDKGTIVRVFSIPGGSQLHEFRRGSYASQIYSLAFSLGGNLLAASSSTQTVHIYRLKVAANLDLDPNQSQDSIEELSALADSRRHGVAAKLRKRVSQARVALPSAVAEMWDTRPRDFAWFKLPLSSKTKTMVALAPASNLVYVASLDGSLYHYSIAAGGGECQRVAEYSLLV